VTLWIPTGRLPQLPVCRSTPAGLFCSAVQDPRSIQRFRFDDSNFRYLSIHRLPNAVRSGDEGTGSVISTRSETRGLGV
jgi:hypothetical protein